MLTMSTPYPATAARRIVTTLFITQCLGSAALIANATVNAIVGATLSGRDDLAGLPGTLLLIGAAGAAPWAGRLMQRQGRRPGLALTAMVIGQMVMVLVMSVTSLHMHHHTHGLDDVSLVIMAHTLGMFGLSIVNGALIDRLGRKAAIGAGAALLIAGSLLAPVSLMTAWLALALFLVGLGWNLCYIAGSSLLSDTLAPAERYSTNSTPAR